MQMVWLKFCGKTLYRENMLAMINTVSSVNTRRKTSDLKTSLGLRIHEETERGDNDTIKMPNGKKVVIDGKSCADL